VKTVTWRVIATVTTIFFVYVFTKDLKTSLLSGIAANIMKTFFCYAHERVWNAFEYGRVRE